MKTISKEDLEKIAAAKKKAHDAISAAEKITLQAQLAGLEARLADTEYKTTVQHTYLKNGLSLTDTINDSTGEVTSSTNALSEGTNEQEL